MKAACRENAGIFVVNFTSANVLASAGMLLSGGLRVRDPIRQLPWCVQAARTPGLCRIRSISICKKSAVLVVVGIKVSIVRAGNMRAADALAAL